MMRIPRVAILAVLSLCASGLWHPSTAADHATFHQFGGVDALKRSIASPEEVGARRSGRFVGVFYFVGNGFSQDATSGPFNIEELLSQGGLDARLNPMNTAWDGSEGSRIYWGESLWGYYRSSDRWAIRRNMQLLTLAGVDFIMFDYTNKEAQSGDINNATHNVINTLQELRSQGWNAPRIAFYTNTDINSGVKSGDMADLIYKEFYQSSTTITANQFEVDGNPLIIGISSEFSGTSIPLSFFTVRESQWPNKVGADKNKPNGWPWIDFDRPQIVRSTTAGARDAISVSVAQHPNLRMSSYRFYGKDTEWGRGYAYGVSDHSEMASSKGANIEEQWSNALAQDVPYTFVTGWNEGGAHRAVEDEGIGYWGPGGDLTDFGFRSGGFIGGTITGGDPLIAPTVDLTFNGRTINASEGNIIRVEYQVVPGIVTTATARAEVFVTTGTTTSYTPGLSVFRDVSQSGGTITTDFDLSGSSQFSQLWVGNLARIRFDPPQWGNTGEILVKSISLRTTTGVEVASWDFSEAASLATEGWFSNGNVSSFARQTGGTVGGTIIGADPSVYSPTELGVDIDASKFIRIRLSNVTNDGTAQLFYTTDADGVFDGNKCLTFAATPNTAGGFSDHILDMTNDPRWKGRLRQLRLDPSANATAGSFAIDHVRIGGVDPQAIPAAFWEFGPTHHMIDAADMEYSRDIEPTRGKIADNYYMQFVDFIRKQRGTEARTFASAPRTISIDQPFSQWDDVSPGFKDFTGDVAARNEAGVGGNILTNNSGRNDFSLAKVARNNANLYFFIQTASNITANSDQNWMMLLLDVDGDPTNGCNGYDFIVNRQKPSDALAVVEKCLGGSNWVKSGDISYAMSGDKLHLAVPKSMLGGITDTLPLRFKWIDNVDPTDPMAFYTNGDAAPDGRFSYEYVTVAAALEHRKGAALPIGNLSASNAYLPASNADGSGNFWSTHNLAAAETAWLQMDLSTVSSIGSIEVTPRVFRRAATAFPRNFHFEYMDAAGTWRKIPGLIFEDFPPPSTGRPLHFKLSEPISARYVRWVGTKHRYDNSGTTFFMQASDFRAFKPAGVAWDFNGSTEGWTAGGETGALSSSVWGTVSATVTGADPKIISPDGLGIRVSPITNSTLRIKFRNATASTIAQIYYLPEGGSWHEDNSVRFSVIPNDGISREYVVDMSTAMGGWNGTIRRLRFDPSMNTSTGSFSIDYIHLGQSSDPAAAWEFAGAPNDMQGWTFGSATTGSVWSETGTIGATLSGPDAQVLSPIGVGIDLAKSKFLRFVLRNRTTDTQAQIFFTTEAATIFDEPKSVKVSIIPNDSELREYVVDMTNVGAWNGVLRQIRIDPVVSASSGSFEIDRIRIQSW